VRYQKMAPLLYHSVKMLMKHSNDTSNLYTGPINRRCELSDDRLIDILIGKNVSIDIRI
jgi:hypothetical protein